MNSTSKNTTENKLVCSIPMEKQCNFCMKNYKEWFVYLRCKFTFVVESYQLSQTYNIVGWLSGCFCMQEVTRLCMHEGPPTLNYLYHARKTIFHWKLTHNYFTQENSVAVDVHLCCLMNPHLFSDFRGCASRCTWACGLGLNCKLVRTRV